jgi:hypothetical protein
MNTTLPDHLRPRLHEYIKVTRESVAAHPNLLPLIQAGEHWFSYTAACWLISIAHENALFIELIVGPGHRVQRMAQAGERADPVVNLA